MSDLIDRQQAIDALKNRWLKTRNYEGIGEDIAEECEIYLRTVPSAQFATDTNVGTKLGTNLAEVGTDCISRQAAIDAVKEAYENDEMFDGYEYRLQELPSAQPEIIRCKDCKYWIPYDWMFSEVWQSRNIADYPEDEIGCKFCDMTMKADDFCSRAERREVTE